MSKIARTAWKNSSGTLLVQLYQWQDYVTTMVPKTSKSAATWWLAPNSSNMPLAMKCQINNPISQIIPNTKLNPPGKTRGHLLLRNVTFLHGMMSIWNHFRPC